MIKAREPVTKLPGVTKAIVTKVTGRPKVHASAAEKQRVYRERKKTGIMTPERAAKFKEVLDIPRAYHDRKRNA